jgi:hypothetical protein
VDAEVKLTRECLDELHVGVGFRNGRPCYRRDPAQGIQGLGPGIDQSSDNRRGPVTHPFPEGALTGSNPLHTNSRISSFLGDKSVKDVGGGIY